MDLIQALARKRKMGAVLITHDLGLAGMYCDQLAVIKDGEIVEKAEPHALTHSATHAYTKRLLAATPHKSKKLHELVFDGTAHLVPAQGDVLLLVQDVTKTYAGKSGPVYVLRGISFDLHKGGCLGLVAKVDLANQRSLPFLPAYRMPPPATYSLRDLHCLTFPRPSLPKILAGPKSKWCFKTQATA